MRGRRKRWNQCTDIGPGAYSASVRAVVSNTGVERTAGSHALPHAHTGSGAILSDEYVQFQRDRRPVCSKLDRNAVGV